MLIISIIVLVFIAVGIYLMTKKSSVTPTVTSVDVPAVPTVDEEALKQSQLDALVEAVAAKAEVDAVIAQAQESIAKADEALNPSDVEEVVEEYEISEEEFQSEVVVNPTEVSSEEVGDSKPLRKKKKRYYKPRAKK